MTSQKRNYYFAFAGVLAAGTILGMTLQSAMSPDNAFQDRRRMNEAFSIVEKRYVEDVDTSNLAGDAIEGMLEGLDPHSVFISAEEMKRVQENFRAEFDGIGISYEWTDGADGKDTLTVLNPLPGGPSEEVGLQAGDRIVAVDGIDAVGWVRDDVEANLKGPRGTEVDVTVVRPRAPKELEFTITRAPIPINTVDAVHMVDDVTGYIKLNRFARSTHEEVRAALNDLKSRGMERLIFDLRGNNGGYMNQAVELVDEFVAGEKMIVYTKSRHDANNEQHLSRKTGLFEEEPVIVLVDASSASASEIVAGALQDHDRALVVGRRTFGKGLVQQQFPLTDGSVLQLTTSRYFTPAGRLIQTPYEDGKKEAYYRNQYGRERDANQDLLKYLDLLDEDQSAAADTVIAVESLLEQVPDSLKFRTDKGRIVLGGGGILPDYIVSSSGSSVVSAVINLGVDNAFVRQWMETNPELRATWENQQEAFYRDFKVDDELYSAFLSYAGEQGLHVVASEEEAPDTVEGEVYLTAAEVAAERHVLETRLKAYVGRRMWGVSGWYPAIHEIDPVFQHAVELWSPAEKLALSYREN